MVKREIPSMNNNIFHHCVTVTRTQRRCKQQYTFVVTLYTVPISSPVTNAMEEVCATTAMVKMNEQITLNVISVCFPNGTKGDNTNWLKVIALSNKRCVIVADFNAHAHFGGNGCTSVTCSRLVENIVDSSLCLLNDGRLTRIPDVFIHKATAIDLFLVTPDLAVNCTWYTEEDCLGSDHIPIIK